MDDEIDTDLGDEAFETLAEITKHNHETILGVQGIIDGSLGTDHLNAEQKLHLIEHFISVQTQLRQPLEERMTFVAMMFG